MRRGPEAVQHAAPGPTLLCVDSEARVARWEQRTEPWLLATAGAFLAAFAWPIVDPGLSGTARAACWAVSGGAWTVFALDFAAKVTLSRDRWHFVRTHPLDLVVVLIPMLRPFALLRLVAMLGILNRRAEHALHGRVMLYVAGSTALLMTVCALVMLDVERGRPGAVVTSFGDALWWSATTITTVGYGDTYPTTGAGRVVAAVLMFSGIALLGVVTATVAAWLVRRVAEEEEQIELATQRDVESLRAEVRALRAELLEHRARPAGEGPER
jgi:voltage-gated potassium channel